MSHPTPRLAPASPAPQRSSRPTALPKAALSPTRVPRPLHTRVHTEHVADVHACVCGGCTRLQPGCRAGARGSRGGPHGTGCAPHVQRGAPGPFCGVRPCTRVPAAHVRTRACEHSCAHVGCTHQPSRSVSPGSLPAGWGAQGPPALPGPCSRGASPAPPAWPAAGGSPACLSGEITGPRRPGHSAQPAPRGPPRPPPTRCPGLGRGRTGVPSHQCTPRPPRCAGNRHWSHWESQSGRLPLPAAKTPNLPPTSWGPPQRHLPPGGVVGGDAGSDHPPQLCPSEDGA